jgi:hypothetical protein
MAWSSKSSRTTTSRSTTWSTSRAITQFTIEPITYINANGLNFNRGNAVKYITRAGLKSAETEIEDLQKAIRYLEIEIETINRWDRVNHGGECATEVWKVLL